MTFASLGFASPADDICEAGDIMEWAQLKEYYGVGETVRTAYEAIRAQLKGNDMAMAWCMQHGQGGGAVQRGIQTTRRVGKNGECAG